MVNLVASLKRPFEDWKTLIQWMLFWVLVYIAVLSISSIILIILILLKQVGGGLGAAFSLWLVVLGTAAILFPLSLIPYLGYLLKLSKSAEGDFPDIKPWKKLMKEGFFSLLIAFVFLLPVGGLYFVSASLFSRLASIVLILITLYLLPLAWFKNYEGALRDAFNFKELLSATRNRQYNKAWAFSFLYIMIIGLLSSLIPIIGIFLIVIWSMTTFDLLGDAYFNKY